MKKLYEVTLEDAIEIIKAGYPSLIERNKWTLKDESQGLGEPAKLMESKTCVFLFWFMDTSIDPNYTSTADHQLPYADEAFFDAKLACYVKAAGLGYDIPELRIKPLFPKREDGTE